MASTPKNDVDHIVGAGGTSNSTAATDAATGFLRRILAEVALIQGRLVTFEEPIEYVYGSEKRKG